MKMKTHLLKNRKLARSQSKVIPPASSSFADYYKIQGSAGFKFDVLIKLAKLREMIEMADQVRIDNDNGTVTENVEDLSIHLDYAIMLSENFSDDFCKRACSLK